MSEVRMIELLLANYIFGILQPYLASIFLGDGITCQLKFYRFQ